MSAAISSKPAAGAGDLVRRVVEDQSTDTGMQLCRHADPRLQAEWVGDLLPKQASDATTVDTSDELAQDPTIGGCVVAHAASNLWVGILRGDATRHRVGVERLDGARRVLVAGRPARWETTSAIVIPDLPCAANSGQ